MSASFSTCEKGEKKLPYGHEKDYASSSWDLHGERLCGMGHVKARCIGWNGGGGWQFPAQDCGFFSDHPPILNFSSVSQRGQPCIHFCSVTRRLVHLIEHHRYDRSDNQVIMHMHNSPQSFFLFHFVCFTHTNGPLFVFPQITPTDRFIWRKLSVNWLFTNITSKNKTPQSK